MSFPFEMWQEIIQKIPSSDKRALWSLSLVSRAFHSTVLPLLYFDVQITGREKQERFYEWILSNEPSSPASYVREYTIIINRNDIPCGKPYTHNSAALARMQHLRKLTLASKLGMPKNLSTGVILHSEDPSWSLPELREFEWDDYGVESDILHFLSRCPELESLELPEWEGTPVPTDLLPKLRRISGDCSTVLAFLPGRPIEELAFSTGGGAKNLSKYLKSNPVVAARIQTLSFAKSYPLSEFLKQIASTLPHLKEFRMALAQFDEMITEVATLRRLEKLVFLDYNGNRKVAKEARMLWSVRLISLYSPTPLGRGSTEPCLELWYSKEKILSQWRRGGDGTRLELVQ
ncbi:hypothetical protein CYLTODRAFT_494999 [Cylindrobasidium torrendii FP15055 ss-10]|uniref:F-box domain-containing protein n=1 Tax=Cylindrobasidium torrendii FP15055 ss-10 TaxID=1314674 RepID=A0A0D7AVH2_9AGAR|nr:hypothetical protein CYLTODRAFT_494999 [Cylindrobasidium torrendii FP15055 ss-10]